MQKRAVVAGSLVLDITMVMDETVRAGSGPLFGEGKQCYLEDVRFYLGGCVGNTGLVLHGLGVPVRLVSRAGDDRQGRIIADILAEQGADFRLGRDDVRGSACGIAVTPPGMDKISFFRRGAPQFFTADDLSGEDLAGADLLHFGYPTAMPTMYANAGAELVRLLQRARGLGVVTALDTSMPDLRSDAARADWRRIWEQALPWTDLFMPSLEELLFMLDRPRYQKALERAGRGDMIDCLDWATVPELADACLDLGAQAVLIKAGKRGLYLKTARTPAGLSRLLGPEALCWRGRELWCPPFQPERVVSATGAGDTAIAGFLAALMSGGSPERALRLGAYAARQCLASADTVSRMEPLAAMEKASEARLPRLPLTLDASWRPGVDGQVFVRR